MATENLNPHGVVAERDYDTQGLIDPGPDANIGPGHNFTTVTKEIAGVVYLPWKKSPKVRVGNALAVANTVSLSRYGRMLRFTRPSVFSIS